MRILYARLNTFVPTFWKYILMLIGCIGFAVDAYAQPCSGSTPSFTVNLTGKADSVWTSTSVIRDGNCCGTTAPDVCIEFMLTLDSMSSGIRLDIPSGALPGGALFYQIGCGTQYPVGQDICLSGVGPHRITFCKPGNNQNIYQIKAIPKPDVRGKFVINQACIGFLKAIGLDDTSITWQSVPNNPIHNAYLSCTEQCDSVSIIPFGSFPPTVTYRVCGRVTGGCGATYFCDTATVRFVTNIGVGILPKNPTVCFGGTTTSIRANPVGGLAPFRYLWNTGDTSASINVGVGSYRVTMLDSLGCTIVADSVIVTSFSLPIDANAGNDTLLCSKRNVASLRGVVLAASGGKWGGGTGIFVPNDTTLLALYYPSTAETNAGSANLRLVTTGNGSCPADTDFVLIQIRPTPAPVINGPNNVCAFKQSTYSTNSSVGNTYQWSVTGGTIVGANNDTSVTIKWGAAGAGSVSVRQTNSSNCDSLVSRAITIQPTPVPAITGTNPVCGFKQSVYRTNGAVGNTFFWSVTGGTIIGSNTDTSVRISWGNTGSGLVSVRQTNSSNCDSLVSLAVTINPTPVPVINGPDSVCEFKQNVFSTNFIPGNSYQWSVTGGSIIGSNTDTTVRILWAAAGNGSVSVRHTTVDLCDSILTLPVLIQPSPVPVITGPANVCEFKQSVYSTNTAAGKTYLWSVSGGSIVGSNIDSTVRISWNATGVGSVSVRQTNSSGCDSLVSRAITIEPTPVPAISGPATICENKQATYTTPFSAANTYQWTVTGGAFIGSTTDTIVRIKWGSTGTGSVSVRKTNSSNCDSLVSLSVIINPTPVPVITGPANVCEFKQSTYSTNASVGNTYQWSVTGGTIVGSNNDTTVTIKWGAAGAGSVSVRQTNSSNCDSLVSRAITIQPTPVPAITGTNPVCGFKQSVYRTNGAVGNTFLWSVTGGTIIGANTDTSVRISWGNTGGGLVSVRQTNSSNCDSLVSLAVTINPTPVPVISGPDSVCEFKQNVFYTNFIAGNTYQWSVTGGSIIGSNTDTTVRILWAAAGNGSVSVKHTTVDLCDSILTLPVLIQPSPVPVITGPANVCEFKQSVYSTNTAAGKTYLWSVTGGSIVGSNIDSSVRISWSATGVGSVSVRQTNSSGCDSLVSRAITIEPTPVPVISGPATICENKQATYTTSFSAANTYQWSVTGGAFIGSTTDTIVRIKWGSTGTGSVSVRKTNSSNCDSLVSLSVIINPTPLPVITGPANVCEFKQSTFSTNASAGNTYQWSVTGGTIVGANNDTTVTIKWGAAGAGSVSVRQTNSSNCDSLVSRAITIQPTPVPAITGTNPVCGFKQSVYRTNGAVGNTFFWSVTGGAIIGSNTDTSVRISWGNTGGGIVSVRQTNSSNCDSLVSLAVTINPTPVPVINGPDSVCEFKQNVFYTNFIPGNSYQWSVTGGSIIGSNTDTIVRILWAAAGNGSVSVRHTTVDLCDSLLTLPVLIQPLPIPVISGPDTVCLNAAYDYQVAANSMHTYLWTIAGGIVVGDSTKHLLKVRFTGTGNKVVTVLLRNQFGCDSSVNKTIFVKPAPIPVLNGPSAVCINTTAVYYAGKITGDTYQWLVNNGTIQQTIGDTQVVVKWGNTDSGWVGVRQTNPQGCDSLVRILVDLKEKPAATIAGDTGVCEFTTHTYQVTPATGMTYVWSVAGGQFTQLSNHTIQVNWGSSGSGLITLTLTNSFNCDSTITLGVSIQPKPVPIITGLQNVCAYSGAVYTTTAIAGHRYKWTVTGGNIAGSDTLNFVAINWGSPGIGTVSLQQISTNGCDSSVSSSITLNNRPTPALSGDTLVCAGTKAYTYKASPSTGGYLYTWNTGTGTLLINQGDTQIVVNWPKAGNQNLFLRMTDITTGCDSLIAYPVRVDTLIMPELLANTLKGCVPLSVNFSIGNITNGYLYQWRFHDLSQSNLPAVKKEYRTAGTFPVQLVATNTGICTDTLKTDVVAQFTPVADFDYAPTDKKIYVNEDTVYFTNQSTGANHFIWSTFPLQYDTIYDTKRVYPEPGTFIIKLWARDSVTGCVDSTTRSIKVWLPEELYIPNAFTPNGDGLNEYFSVSVTNIIDFHLIIFDRWGTIMFETDDPDFRWYGDFKGGPAQSDVYGYLLTGKGYHGKHFERSGTITLLR